VKIVPRFLFEGWSGEQLKHFLGNERVQTLCGLALVEFIQRNELDGAVVEIWLQIMSMTRGNAAEYLLEVIETWTKQFHKADLIFILPLSPPLSTSFEEIGIASKAIMGKLAEQVDYVNVMTYDYPSSEISGVAPVPWVEANIRFAIESVADASKILLGLNFYGYDRTNGNMNAILGKQFTELLSKSDARLEWDEKAGEHRVVWG
jgi:chitinase domain-containing protein 1